MTEETPTNATEAEIASAKLAYIEAEVINAISKHAGASIAYITGAKFHGVAQGGRSVFIAITKTGDQLFVRAHIEPVLYSFQMEMAIEAHVARLGHKIERQHDSAVHGLVFTCDNAGCMALGLYNHETGDKRGNLFTDECAYTLEQ